MNTYSAVFDVGKTNKKLIIYDDKLNLIEQRTAQFEEYSKDGVQFESISGTVAWFKQQLKIVASRYPVGVISIATHGATIACVGHDNNLSVPMVAYTTEPGKKFHDTFFKEFGDPIRLQKETATPDFGNLICVAKNIYYLKNTYPGEFKKTKYILNFPQYFGFLLTGKIGMEPTYLGSHTYLWDYKNQRWSDVAHKLDILSMLPEKLSTSWDVLGTISDHIAEQTGLSPDTIVTMGIHDSNSSLLPYTIKSKQDFVLNSTGTWCVAMGPSKDIQFHEDDYGKIVYYNLNPFNQPIKTAIFMGGLEFETYINILKQIHGDKKYPDFNMDITLKIINEKELFILPSVIQGTGQFPDSPPIVLENGKQYHLKDILEQNMIPEFFKDFELGYAVLIISLAIQTKIALDRVGANNSKQIFIEGGFKNNSFYCSLLTALYPDSEISLTNLNEATAFGAALLGKAALDHINPMDLSSYFDLDLKKVHSIHIIGLDEYIEMYLSSIK